MSTDSEQLLNARVRLPQDVVHRSFVAETVVLNLKTGRYHGLNPIAGNMLEVLGTGLTLREAAAQISEEYGEDQATVEGDMLAFCRDLLDRELVELVYDD